MVGWALTADIPRRAKVRIDLMKVIFAAALLEGESEMMMFEIVNSFSKEQGLLIWGQEGVVKVEVAIRCWGSPSSFYKWFVQRRTQA